MPYLSVVMPVYGVENYVAKAIESVLSQTFQDWELLIVNDGTKDRSRDIAHQYEIEDPRIKILDKENGGLSDARNVGLMHAQGKYVHFFDSDDYIGSDYYLNMVSSMSTKNSSVEPDVVVSGYIVESQDADGDVLSRKSRRKKANSIDEIPKTEVLDFVENYFTYAWNKFFKVDFLKNNQLLYQKGLYSIEDIEFMRRFVKYQPIVGLCYSNGYYYVNRARVSLGRCYNRDIVGFNANKISYLKELLAFFLHDTDVVEDSIKNRYLEVFNFLFQSLFFYTQPKNKKEYLEEINYILNYDELFQTINKAKVETFGEKLLKFLVKHKCPRWIYRLYQIVKLKKRIG